MVRDTVTEKLVDPGSLKGSLKRMDSLRVMRMLSVWPTCKDRQSAVWEECSPPSNCPCLFLRNTGSASRQSSKAFSFPCRTGIPSAGAVASRSPGVYQEVRCTPQTSPHVAAASVGNSSASSQVLQLKPSPGSNNSQRWSWSL